MSETIKIVLCIILPLVGTTVGSGLVFFLKGAMPARLQKALLGFAAGVMIAASVWSLINPAIEMAEASGVVGWVPAVIGFLGGIFFLLALDSFVPHMHLHDECPEGKACGLGKSTMLVFAVALHNLPEGMAVGVVLSGMLQGNQVVTAAAAITLAIGIAIQNLPEGAIISMPLVGNGVSKKKSFLYGFASGVVEPIGAILTLLLTSFIQPALPYVLTFAAGAMIYVVVEELIPESQEGQHSNIGTIGAALGFALMMVLDVALG